MLQIENLTQLLEPFGLSLDGAQLELVQKYLGLLERWNRALNLTAVRDPSEMVARHFGESLYLARVADPAGPLLDVGSGAGFPGLALKIVRPELRVVLLEPVAKKRAFLKEVARECRFDEVEVNGTRIEEFSGDHAGEFGSVTLRAVGGFSATLPAISRCLAPDGRVYAWLTSREAEALARDVAEFGAAFAWSAPIALPLSRDREIWAGRCREMFHVKR